ncbi:unnamed protein product, partial [Rotaria magnacalcarata]
LCATDSEIGNPMNINNSSEEAKKQSQPNTIPISGQSNSHYYNTKSLDMQRHEQLSNREEIIVEPNFDTLSLQNFLLNKMLIYGF